AMSQASAVPAADPSPPADLVPSHGPSNGKPQGGARRLLLEAVDCPISDVECGLMPDGLVLITDDNRGIAQALAAGIRSSGWRTVLIGGPTARIDWTSPAAVEAAVTQARREGPLAGLVHLLPLHEARDPGLDPTAWADRIVPEVRGLFLLAKA